MKTKYWAAIYFAVLIAPLAVPLYIYIFNPTYFGMIPSEGLNMDAFAVERGYENPRTLFMPFSIAWGIILFFDTALLGGKVFVSEDERA